MKRKSERGREGGAFALGVTLINLFTLLPPSFLFPGGGGALDLGCIFYGKKSGERGRRTVVVNKGSSLKPADS